MTRESYKQGGRRSSTADMGLFPILTSNKKKTVYTNGRPPWYSLQTGLKSEKERYKNIEYIGRVDYEPINSLHMVYIWTIDSP